MMSACGKKADKPSSGSLGLMELSGGDWPPRLIIHLCF